MTIEKDLLICNKSTRHGLFFCQHDAVKAKLQLSLIEQKMKSGGGVLFVDTSPEKVGFEAFRKLAADNYRACDVRLLDLEDPENSYTYSPLVSGLNAEVAKRIMAIFSGADIEADVKKRIYSAILAIVGALRAVGKPITFKALQMLLSDARHLDDLLRELPEDDESYTDYKAFIETLLAEDTTTGSLYVSEVKLNEYFMNTVEYFEYFTEGSAGDILSAEVPDISITSFLDENELLYVSVPSIHEDDVFRVLMKMLFSELCVEVKARKDAGYICCPSSLVLLDDVQHYMSSCCLPALDFAALAHISFLSFVEGMGALSENNPKTREFVMRLMGKCHYVVSLSHHLDYLEPFILKSFEQRLNCTVSFAGLGQFECSGGTGLYVDCEKAVRFSIEKPRVLGSNNLLSLTKISSGLKEGLGN